MLRAAYLILIVTVSLGFSHFAFADDTKPKNIIFLIGDGMGPAYTSAYRYFKSNNGEEVDATIFDQLLVGMATTYPKDSHIISDSAAAAQALSSGQKGANKVIPKLVTDSAASATALSSGSKSYNGAIGLDNNQTPLPSLFQLAKERDMRTAVVVTSQVNHATPASFIAHVNNRNEYNKIADQYLDNRVNGQLLADIIFGGGTKYFIREDRNLVDEFIQQGYQYADDLTELDRFTQLPAIGLFAHVGLPYAIDSTYPMHLRDMTEKALSLLDQDGTPFVMMVEGSQIDWCGHDNDIACTMAEMDDFAATLTLVTEYAKKQGNTLVVVTADHNTGGLSLGANGQYFWNVDAIKQIKASQYEMSKRLLNSEDLFGMIGALTGILITEQQLEALKTAKNAGRKPLEIAIRNLLNRHTNTGWTTLGHTADDVQVFAFGPGSELFKGMQDNTDIAHKIQCLLK